MPSSLLKFVKQYSVKIGGRRYPVVKIDNQLWMAENLDFADENISVGNMISTTNPAACYYDEDETTYGFNGYKCGLLYNWYAVNYLNENRSTLFPDGWRVASISDYDTLFTTPIEQLKSENRSWFSNGGTNESGFSAIPSGRWGHVSPNFRYLGSDMYLYTSTSTYSNYAVLYYIDFVNNATGHDNTYAKVMTGSIRLVKSLE